MKTTKLNHAAVLAEAEDVLLPGETGAQTIKATAAISLSGFKALYTKTIRPAMLLAISVLRLFRRGDSATALAQAIAFIDLWMGGELPSM